VSASNFGRRVVVIAEAVIAGHERLAVHVLHDDFELVHEEQRLAGFLRLLN
jgi:hypothetical protein